MYVLAEGEFATYILLGIAVLTVGFLLRRVQRYYSRPRTPLPSYPPEPKATRGHHLDAPSQMAAWEVQMHDVARELSAQLDTKMGLLEQLIREADRAAARLEAATAAAQGKSASPPTPVAPVSSPSGLSNGSPRPESRPVSQAEGLKVKLSALSERASSSPPETDASESEGDLGRRPSRDRRYDEIYTLADYGYDAPEIAQRIGTPVGEVQLILSLRGKR